MTKKGMAGATPGSSVRQKAYSKQHASPGERRNNDEYKMSLWLKAGDSAPLEENHADNRHQPHGADAAVLHNGQCLFAGMMSEKAVGHVSQPIDVQGAC